MRERRKSLTSLIVKLLSPARYFGDIDLMSPQPWAVRQIFRAKKAGQGCDVAGGPWPSMVRVGFLSFILHDSSSRFEMVHYLTHSRDSDEFAETSPFSWHRDYNGSPGRFKKQCDLKVELTNL